MQSTYSEPSVSDCASPRGDSLDFPSHHLEGDHRNPPPPRAERFSEPFNSENLAWGGGGACGHESSFQPCSGEFIFWGSWLQNSPYVPCPGGGDLEFPAMCTSIGCHGSLYEAGANGTEEKAGRAVAWGPLRADPPLNRHMGPWICVFFLREAEKRSGLASKTTAPLHEPQSKSGCKWVPGASYFAWLWGHVSTGF